MRCKLFCMLLGPLVLAPTAALACPCVAGYDGAQILSANSTVPLMSYTGYEGHLEALKCVFPSGGSVKVEIVTDTGTDNANSTSFVIDSSVLERESSGAGQFLSDWIPLGIIWYENVSVKLNNTNLGTSTINCWVSWAADQNIE